jgi:hypothetical protein
MNVPALLTSRTASAKVTVPSVSDVQWVLACSHATFRQLDEAIAECRNLIRTCKKDTISTK